MDQDNDKALREQLLGRLRGRGAHMPFEEAVRDFPMDKINTPFPNGSATPWGLLEHLRMGQRDILDYCTNPGYHEKEWPREHWPAEGRTATPDDWNATIEQFLQDKAALEALVEDRNTDLFAKIPWGGDHTILREILIITDHNAFHVGEFAITRQVMNTWGER